MLNKGECFVANAFVGKSKKTGNDFYAVNVVIPNGEQYDVQMGFCNADIVGYVREKGAGVYKYSIGFGGRVDGLEFVRKANL